MRFVGGRPSQLFYTLPAPSTLLPVATELQVKEAGNPQYPLDSSLGSLVGKQETVSVSLRRTIIDKKKLYGMALWRKRGFCYFCLLLAEVNMNKHTSST